MGRLPDMVYGDRPKTVQVVEFAGLNRRSGAKDGELQESVNLSTEPYPQIAARRGRRVENGIPGLTALYDWNKLVYVAEGVLYYDGEAVCNVTDGEKQFSVINTKLVVWPDKLCIDLESREVVQMDASLASDIQVVFTANSLTFTPDPVFKADLANPRFTASEGGYQQPPYIVTYGHDKDALAWTEQDGWTLPEADTTHFFQFNDDGFVFLPRVSYYEETDTYSFSMPEVIWSYSKPTVQAFIDRGYDVPSNNLGFFAVCNYVDGEIGVSYTSVTPHWDVFHVDHTNQPFATLFHAGDTVRVDGCAFPLNNKDKAVVQSIDEVGNKLMFSDGTFVVPYAYYLVTEELEPGYYRLIYYVGSSKNTVNFTTTVTMKAGYVLTLPESGKSVVNLYDDEGGQLEGIKTGGSGTPLAELNGIRYAQETGTITVQRVVPELDYICELDNRLWGVCNQDKTIYASALGDPVDWYNFQGLATDPYAVAVGSKGDFTACVAYSDTVLCFKEDLLHKVLGSIPADFYINTQTVAGVAQGCHKSAVVINDILYYVGKVGVYAYGGSTPQYISYKLGEVRLKHAVGGTDGVRYYLSGADAADGDGVSLYSYDTDTGLWIREDETRAVDFCRHEGALYMLANGTIYTLNTAETSSTMEWMLSFAPFQSDLAQARKRYKWVRLRYVLGKNAACLVWVSYDSGETWRTVFPGRDVKNAVMTTVNIPVDWARSDSMRVRISGTGAFQLVSMEREFVEGSVKTL